MGHLLCRGSLSVELPSRLREIPVLSFWPRCLFELVLRVRRGLSIGSSRGAGPLLLEMRKSELLEWGLLRRPETEKLHWGWGWDWPCCRPRPRRIPRSRKPAFL